MNAPVPSPAARKRAPRSPRAKVAAVPAVPAVAVAVPATPVEPVAPTVKYKLIRDSFTFPENEYAQIALLKNRALTLAHHAKKSEVLRAGIAALSALSDEALLSALQAVTPIKTGRPKSGKRR
jgi:hypothetical protein